MSILHLRILFSDPQFSEVYHYASYVCVCVWGGGVRPPLM